MSKVFDTNIIIYHLNDTLGPSAETHVLEAIEEGSWVSVVTRIEVLGWPGHSDDSLRRAEDFLNMLSEEPLTPDVVDRCIGLRRQQRMRLPDAVIAATALHLELPLMTRNVEDFKDIDGLELMNPFE